MLPYYGDYRLTLIFETEESMSSDMPNIAAVDLGLSNIAAIVCNAGVPGILYKGGAAKACNQWYNKRLSELKAIQMKGLDPKKHHFPPTKQMLSLSRYRDCFLNDFLHKTAADLMKYVLKNSCGTLVVGVNKFQKQGADMGDANNQAFVQLPLHSFRRILSYLCERYGIRYIEREESYTSKASFVDMDPIPTYNVNDNDGTEFSGKRITRGLYKSKDGTILNADINAACNILRKEFPHAFDGIDPHIFKELSVVRFYDMYQKGDPVKRLAAS